MALAVLAAVAIAAGVGARATSAADAPQCFNYDKRAPLIYDPRLQGAIFEENWFFDESVSAWAFIPPTVRGGTVSVSPCGDTFPVRGLEFKRYPRGVYYSTPILIPADATDLDALIPVKNFDDPNDALGLAVQYSNDGGVSWEDSVSATTPGGAIFGIKDRTRGLGGGINRVNPPTTEARVRVDVEADAVTLAVIYRLSD